MCSFCWGAILGVVLAVPVLLALARLAQPFANAQGLDQGADEGMAWPSLPPLLWGLLAGLPIAAALIGWATAQATVRGWAAAAGMNTRPHPVRVAPVALTLVSFALLAWTAGFVWFVQDVMRPAPLPRQADGIVALTGGADRIATAIEMLAQNRARLLLISGVGPATEFASLFRGTGIAPGTLAGRITVGRAATDTLGNAEEAADWARAHGLHSLIVVTASYHMRRALTEIARTLPDATLFAGPVLPPALRSAAGFSTLRLLAGEYTKYLAAQCGLTLLQRGRESGAPPVNLPPTNVGRIAVGAPG